MHLQLLHLENATLGCVIIYTNVPKLSNKFLMFKFKNEGFWQKKIIEFAMSKMLKTPKDVVN